MQTKFPRRLNVSARRNLKAFFVIYFIKSFNQKRLRDTVSERAEPVFVPEKDQIYADRPFHLTKNVIYFGQTACQICRIAGCVQISVKISVLPSGNGVNEDSPSAV